MADKPTDQNSNEAWKKPVYKGGETGKFSESSKLGAPEKRPDPPKRPDPRSEK